MNLKYKGEQVYCGETHVGGLHHEHYEPHQGLRHVGASEVTQPHGASCLQVAIYKNSKNIEYLIVIICDLMLQRQLRDTVNNSIRSQG